MTDAEKKLWWRLRNDQLGLSFRRQHPIGVYVVDFFAPSIGLVIELDGSQHGMEAHVAFDASRFRCPSLSMPAGPNFSKLKGFASCGSGTMK
jgi:very-short-patch-repair endonuclease